MYGKNKYKINNFTRNPINFSILNAFIWLKIIYVAI